MRGSPWFFFQTAEDPGGEWGADPGAGRTDSGALVCFCCLPGASGGSGAPVGPSRFRDGGRSEALFLSWGAASVSCWGASWGGDVSRLDKKGGPRRGGAAESGRGTEAGKEPSGFGIWNGSCWGVDTESSRGGFWSMATGVTVADGGGTGSVGFVLPRGTLEQVCKWVRRPR